MSESLIERVLLAAESNGVDLESDIQRADTIEGAVYSLINTEWIATDSLSGNSARGESPTAAWANLRGVPKRSIHNKLVEWHSPKRAYNDT